MESLKIYEESYNELVKITKSTSSDQFTIDTTKLDTESKSQLLSAINEVLSRRKKQLDKFIFGARTNNI